MNIPDAAVEAAVYAYGIDGKAHEWERKMILNILEAAAPHMLDEAKAEAWDECESAKYLVIMKADESGLARVKNNPYRTTNGND